MASLDQVLEAVVGAYLSSRDFNGVAAARLLAGLHTDWTTLRTQLDELLAAGRIGMLFSDSDENPHILRHGFESVDVQRAKLSATGDFAHSVAYPMPAALEPAVDSAAYAGRPYSLAMALGSPQLQYRTFDLHVLETYRNDPRYLYQTDDIGGSISLRDEFFESNAMPDSDQVLLQSFGFAYDDEKHRAVAVFLRYLSDLSAEHQQIWSTRELTGEYGLHPDYFRRSILGEWGERGSIFSALLVEQFVINQMSAAMGRPPLFRKDYGEHAEGRPRQLEFLVRPTLEEFNAFVLTLDKTLSENINKEFFGSDVPDETEEQRPDGKIVVRPRGTIAMLDEWLRGKMKLPDWTPWDVSIGTLRTVRKLRQKPAHAIDENVFDQAFFQQQRDLVVRAYDAVRTIRLLFANHPDAKAVEVPDWLYQGLIWDI